MVVVPTTTIVGTTGVIRAVNATPVHDYDPLASSSQAQRHSGLRAQGVGALCQPVVGSGKAVGVPIVIQEVSGVNLTDKTGLTFELDDGVGTTQDVTSMILAPEEQPLVAGDSLPNLAIAWRPGMTRMYNNESPLWPTSGEDKNLDFTHPGYYFLDCVPDAGDASIVFAPGMTLKAKRAGAVVASGVVAGRGTVKFFSADPFAPVTPDLAAAGLIFPNPSEDITLADRYLKVIDTTGIRFLPSFAAMAMMGIEAQRAAEGTDSCWLDLLEPLEDSLPDPLWQWSQSGLDYIAELSNADATSWSILGSRTSVFTSVTTTSVSGNQDECLVSEEENANMMNVMVAYLFGQMLLIDGPAGRIPTVISDQQPLLKPAVVLASTAMVTTTSAPSTTVAVASTTVAPITVTSTTTAFLPTTTLVANTPVAKVDVASSGTLPSTGGSDSSQYSLWALGLLIGGSLLAGIRRRMSR
jgi:LPXTG-motif cell wall-anchored protein